MPAVRHLSDPVFSVASRLSPTTHGHLLSRPSDSARPMWLWIHTYGIRPRRSSCADVRLTTQPVYERSAQHRTLHWWDKRTANSSNRSRKRQLKHLERDSPANDVRPLALFTAHVTYSAIRSLFNMPGKTMIPDLVPNRNRRQLHYLHNVHLLLPIKSESDCERPLLGQWRTAADSADPNAQSEDNPEKPGLPLIHYNS